MAALRLFIKAGGSNAGFSSGSLTTTVKNINVISAHLATVLDGNKPRTAAVLPSRFSATDTGEKKYGVQGTTFMIPYTGEPAEKFPKRMKIEKDKSYKWCACGHSKRQPFCDGSHKRLGLTELRPVEYISDSDKQVSWCQCKWTKNRPFCDGSHKKLPAGPIFKDTAPYIVYDQYDEIVDKGVAKKLGLKTGMKGWILP